MPKKNVVEPIEEATKKVGTFSQVARGALNGIGGAFGKIGGMFLQGGIWGAAAAAITKAFSYAWDHFAKESERAAKRAERAFNESLSSIKDGAEAIDKAFDSAMSGIDKAISRFDAMQNSVKELTKAEIELAKQHAIANGMDAASVNAAAADLSAQVDFEAEERRLQNLIAMEQKRVDAAKDAEAKTAEEVKKATEQKAAAEADYQKKREEYARKAVRSAQTWAAMAQGQSFRGLSDEEIEKEAARGRADFDESDEAAKMRENIRKAQDALNGIKTDEKALAAADEASVKIEQAQTALDVLTTKREARELAVQNEIAAKVEADHKAQAEKDKAAAKKSAAERANAEVKAAQDAAKERDRLDRELHQKRMADLKAEIAEQSKAATGLRATTAAAKSEFDRAFAMFRDPERAAAEIGEEKAYQKDLDRLHKSASRYGGKWRIDELSRLMAAGDSQGVTDTLAGWRKSRGFTPEVEAMVRAAAAEQTKTTAEEELRKIEANTAGLADKLDELLSMKGT